MPIDSVSANHTSSTQAILPSSTRRLSKAPRHSTLANAIRHVHSTQATSSPSTKRPSEATHHTVLDNTIAPESRTLAYFANSVLADHINEITTDTPIILTHPGKHCRNPDSECMFNVYKILPEGPVREKLIQFYASQKNPEDWQADWNDLAPECPMTSIQFLLHVKRRKDSQAPHQTSQMNVNGSHPKKMTHLMHASENGDVDAIKLLLDNDAAPCRKEEGWNAFLLAANKGHTEAVRVLLEHAKDRLLDTRVFYGYSALMLAVRTTSIETVKLLLEEGIDTRCRGYDGKNALFIAIEYHNIGAIDLLLPDAYDSTFMIAQEQGNEEIMYSLREHYNRLHGMPPPVREDIIHQRLRPVLLTSLKRISRYLLNG